MLNEFVYLMIIPVIRVDFSQASPFFIHESVWIQSESLCHLGDFQPAERLLSPCPLYPSILSHSLILCNDSLNRQKHPFCWNCVCDTEAPTNPICNWLCLWSILPRFCRSTICRPIIFDCMDSGQLWCGRRSTWCRFSFVVLFLLIIHFTAIQSMDKVENDQLLYLWKKLVHCSCHKCLCKCPVSEFSEESIKGWGFVTFRKSIETCPSATHASRSWTVGNHSTPAFAPWRMDWIALYRLVRSSVLAADAGNTRESFQTPQSTVPFVRFL